MIGSGIDPFTEKGSPIPRFMIVACPERQVTANSCSQVRQVCLNLGPCKKVLVLEGSGLSAERADRAQIDRSVSPAADVVDRDRWCTTQFAASLQHLGHGLGRYQCNATWVSAPNQVPQLLAQGGLAFGIGDCVRRQRRSELTNKGGLFSAEV